MTQRGIGQLLHLVSDDEDTAWAILQAIGRKIKSLDQTTASTLRIDFDDLSFLLLDVEGGDAPRMATKHTFERYLEARLIYVEVLRNTIRVATTAGILVLLCSTAGDRVVVRARMENLP